MIFYLFQFFEEVKEEKAEESKPDVDDVDDLVRRALVDFKVRPKCINNRPIVTRNLDKSQRRDSTPE